MLVFSLFLASKLLITGDKGFIKSVKENCTKMDNPNPVVFSSEDRKDTKGPKERADPKVE
jgi:hypothetical protein